MQTKITDADILALEQVLEQRSESTISEPTTAELTAELPAPVAG
jgi:hypothetical protein